MDFLYSVVDHQVRNAGGYDWSSVFFVFPNRRAGVFFSDAVQRWFHDHDQSGSVFGLNITTIGDLLAEGSEAVVCDRMTLSCKLYEAYSAYVDEEASHGNVSEVKKDFGTFYSWCSAFLNDFDDIDRNMVDTRELYAHVEEWQRLGDNLENLSDELRGVIEAFWGDVFTESRNAFGEKVMVLRRFVEEGAKRKAIYDKFRSILKRDGLTYAGQLLRNAANGAMIGSLAWHVEGRRYVFVGFSYLCKAEETVMAWLAKETGRATFYWDYTPEMLDASASANIHSAAHAIRKWVEMLPPPRDYTPPVESEALGSVKTTEVSYPNGQLGVVRKWVDDIVARKGELRRTAIILTDNNMLIPLLSVLPQDKERINVTMGYSLRYTNVAGLVYLLQELHRPSSQRDGLFSTRAVRAILQHPCVADVDGIERTRKVVDQLVRENKTYISTEELGELPLTSLIVRTVSQSEVSEYVRKVLETVYTHYAAVGDQFNRETTYEALKVANKFQQVQALIDGDVADTALLLSFLSAMVNMQEVDFKGEPLAGLQIMGILETRAVDFDNVLVMDMIDGNWPPVLDKDTMIPHAVRAWYGLPSKSEQDSTYAYYFSRLMSRAKEVVFMHPVLATNGQMTTLSRYVQQLKISLRKEGKPAMQTYGRHKMTLTQGNDFELSKKELRETIAKRFYRSGNGGRLPLQCISPTGLSDYIDCPLKFFVNRGLGIRSKDDIVEDAEDNHIGTIFHYVMEHLYHDRGLPFTITQQKKKELEKDIERLTREGFEQTLRISKIAGRNIIYFDLIQGYAKKMLAKEAEGTIITATEEEICVDYVLKNGETVVLKGIIDRQHTLGDEHYIVDYKTGSVQAMKISSVEDLFNPAKHSSNKAIMQTLTYCYMLKKRNVHSGTGLTGGWMPSVFKVRDVYKVEDNSEWVAQYDGENVVYTGEFEKEFDSRLEQLIEEMFDEERGFVQNKSGMQRGSCAYCDLSGLCNR